VRVGVMVGTKGGFGCRQVDGGLDERSFEHDIYESEGTVRGLTRTEGHAVNFTLKYGIGRQIDSSCEPVRVTVIKDSSFIVPSQWCWISTVNSGLIMALGFDMVPSYITSVLAR